MFLKIATSLLKIAGMRTGFRGMLPIWPKPVALVKQLRLITYASPVLSAPVAPFVGSQVITARALPGPPVKSVIIVHTVAEVWIDPAGKVCPAVIVAVPEVYV